MKEIKLSQQGPLKGKYVALVDDDDYEYINQWRWYSFAFQKIRYAMREVRLEQGLKDIL